MYFDTENRHIFRYKKGYGEDTSRRDKHIDIIVYSTGNAEHTGMAVHAAVCVADTSFGPISDGLSLCVQFLQVSETSVSRRTVASCSEFR